ncbi:MAG TPA: sodium:solute symporter family protein [Acidobacteriaceae bacterium]|jgi:SSS family solute:Na+ symporter|nr:sodium:solute symporter family protein [Acidobacteriaceae bacterium]
MTSPRAVALTVIFTIVLLGSGIGFYAGRRRTMSLEQWTVGGRAFGTFLMWLLMAGEIYTAFSFLGVSGWAYSRGGPVLYVLAFMILGNVVAFFILPPIWDLGCRYGLQTLPDFFQMRYGSRKLAALTAIIGIAFMIPYLELQVTGLGIIMEVSSFGGIGRTQAMVIGTVLMAGFLLASGVRAVAWVSVLKDFLMIVAVVSIGIWVPHHYFGGTGRMFSTLERVHPGHLTMPGATANLGHVWFISTVLLSAFGGCMWPHIFGASFTAKSGDILRRNAIVLPVYAISLGLLFIAGFAALLVVPGLKNGDLSLLTVVRQAFPPWMLGLIGGAGALTAMVPAAVLLLSASTLFAKNLWRPTFAPAMSDDQVARLAKRTVVALGLISLYFAVYSSSTLVSLLLLGYAGVTQFFPGIVLGLFWKRITTAGIFSGLVVGVAGTAALLLTGRDPLAGCNAGFLALCANFAVAVLVSLLSPASSARLAQNLPVGISADS